MDRSESWVSQVERGVLPVERLALLQQMANVLDVGLLDLRPEVVDETPYPTPVDTDLEQLRQVITGHPDLAALLAPPAPPGEASDLAVEAQAAWAAAHHSDFGPLAVVIPKLEASARLAPSSDRAEYFALLARCYQAASFSFAGQGEADAAWVAADRAMAASESTGEPLAVVASHFRLAHTLIRLQRRQQAAQLAEDTIHALAPRAVDTADQRLLSLYGAMHLVRAVLAGFEHDRSQARSDLAEAERIARIVGDDRNDFDTEFGATNVRLHRVAIAVDLGDAGEAIELGEATNATHLSHERQMRLLLDLARAYSQRRQLTQAVEALERAEAAAPELFRSHHAAIRVVDQLIPLATGSAKERLNRLARTMRARTA